MRATALVVLASAVLSAQVASIRPEGLRCEYRTNPLGIDVAEPRLSWRAAALDPGARGLRQSAYRILVASREADLNAAKGDLWDSGKVGSDESAHIVYRGKPLGSGARAFWRVRVWDQAGAASPWSQTAHWSMGLLNGEDWKGKWIGKDGGQTGAPEARVLPARMLRKEFEAPGKILRATAYISGLGVNELYLNGRKVGDHVLSPGLTEYDKRVFYVAFDVTGQMLAGRNTVGVMLGNGRYWAPRVKSPIAMRNFGYPKLLLQLEVEFAGGSRQVIASDETWKLTTGGPLGANNEFDGEEYDARLEMAGWSRPGFDDATWEPARVVEPPKGALVAQMAEPLRVTQTLKPLKITEPAKGAYVFDMGQNMVGWCKLRVSGPKGATVTLRHAETLQPDGTLGPSVTSVTVKDKCGVVMVRTTPMGAPVVSLQQTIDKLAPPPGDTVTYTFSYQNTGTATAGAFMITDVLPSQVSFIPGSAKLNGTTVVPDPISSDGKTVQISVGDLAGGQQGTFVFQVQVK